MKRYIAAGGTALIAITGSVGYAYRGSCHHPQGPAEGHGMKVKGGMYCDTCDKPVSAQKSTDRFRNSLLAVAAPATGGYSMAAAGVGQWHCPDCGGPVRKKRASDARIKGSTRHDVPWVGPVGGA